MTNFTPIDAFICGHDISYVGTYFDQVLLTDRLSFSGTPLPLNKGPVA